MEIDFINSTYCVLRYLCDMWSHNNKMCIDPRFHPQPCVSCNYCILYYCIYTVDVTKIIN